MKGSRSYIHFLERGEEEERVAKVSLVSKERAKNAIRERGSPPEEGDLREGDGNSTEEREDDEKEGVEESCKAERGRERSAKRGIEREERIKPTSDHNAWGDSSDGLSESDRVDLSDEDHDCEEEEKGWSSAKGRAREMKRRPLTEVVSSSIASLL